MRILAVIGHDDAEIDEQVLAKIAILDLGFIDHPPDVVRGCCADWFVKNDAGWLIWTSIGHDFHPPNLAGSLSDRTRLAHHHT